MQWRAWIETQLVPLERVLDAEQLTGNAVSHGAHRVAEERDLVFGEVVDALSHAPGLGTELERVGLLLGHRTGTGVIGAAALGVMAIAGRLIAPAVSPAPIRRSRRVGASRRGLFGEAAL